MASVVRVQLVSSALTATETGSGVSLEPASQAFVGWLRVSAINGATTLNAKIQHSADKSNWVDLVSFTALVGVTGTEAKEITFAGVLPFVRGVVTLAGATQTATVDLALYHDKS